MKVLVEISDEDYELLKSDKYETLTVKRRALLADNILNGVRNGQVVDNKVRTTYSEYKKEVIKALSEKDSAKLEELHNEDITWYRDVLNDLYK